MIITKTEENGEERIVADISIIKTLCAVYVIKYSVDCLIDVVRQIKRLND